MTLLMLTLSHALACAGLIHEEGSLAESGASTTVFELGDGETTVTYEVLYEGDASDFGWIVPVPAEVLDIQDGDEEWLASLRQVSAPLVIESQVDEAATGCGSRNAKGGNDSIERGADNGVEVTAAGFTGTYDYVVVEATDAQSLTDWAVENGWSISGVEDDLQHYIDLGHRFALLGLHVDAQQNGMVAMPPVSIRYASEELRFPSVMAHSGEAQRSTVFVVADERAALTDGWTHTDLDEIRGDEATEAFEDAIADLGKDRAWGRIWAGGFDDRFATRFELSAEANLHDRDAVFGQDGTKDELTTIIEIGTGSQAALLLLPLFGILGLRRKG